MTASATSPTIADVTRISAMRDAVQRNRAITQCYHDLAVALGRRIRGGANWCAVATWASRQAGQSIRKEDLRRALERVLTESDAARGAVETLQTEAAAIRGEGPESLLGALEALHDALSPAAAFERSSDAVARGNLKVFEEIGAEFARFLTLFEGQVPDEATVSAFCAELRPGSPPEGQDLLRHAFGHYYRALNASGKERAEWLFLANLEVGFHEQTRLQPEILEAMNAPVVEPADLRGRLLDELLPDSGSRARLALSRLRGEAAPVIEAADRLAHEAQRLGRELVTERLMTLELPGGRVLRLGADLPSAYPDALRALDNPELRAFLTRVDPTPDSPLSSGAGDWSRLPERMHFIADLFRAYHQDAPLFSPPFDPTARPATA
jgi:hypothetical protein